MGWTAPKTWLGEKVTVDKLNEQIRDNMIALKSPQTDYFNQSFGAGTPFTTSSTTFVDVDSSFSLDLTTEGGDVLIAFCGNALGSGFLDVLYDGARLGGVDGLLGSTSQHSSGIFWLLQNVPAGVHTFVLQYKAASGSFSLYGPYPSQFWVREVS